jgi:hypothetical protein
MMSSDVRLSVRLIAEELNMGISSQDNTGTLARGVDSPHDNVPGHGAMPK